MNAESRSVSATLNVLQPQKPHFIAAKPLFREYIKTLRKLSAPFCRTSFYIVGITLSYFRVNFYRSYSVIYADQPGFRKYYVKYICVFNKNAVLLPHWKQEIVRGSAGDYLRCWQDNRGFRKHNQETFWLLGIKSYLCRPLWEQRSLWDTEFYSRI